MNKPVSVFTPQSKKPIGQIGPLKLEDPRTLLSPHRLDLAVKIAFAKSLLGQPLFQASIDPRLLYDSHISARTAGIEPNAEFSKRNIDDYRHFFEIIIHSIRKFGFDEDDPVRVSSKTGLVLNGAHRVAASIALGVKKIPVIYDSNAVGRRWGFDWFATNGFNERETKEIALQYMHFTMKEYNIGIIWPSNSLVHDEVLESIRCEFDIIYLNNFILHEGISEFVYDVYSADHGLAVEKSAENIQKKVNRLQDSKNSRVTVFIIACDRFEDSINLRERLRDKFSDKGTQPRFDVLHMSTSFPEREHLKQIVMSSSTLESYGLRKRFSENLLNRAESLQIWLQENNVPKNRACIVGGAVLDLFGIKKCDDIDVVLPYDDRRKKFTGSSEQLVKGVDLAGYGYSKKHSVCNWYTDDQLIFCFDLFVAARGLKFASLEIVHQRKRVGGREKDVTDVKSIAYAKYGDTLFDCDDFVNPSLLDKSLGVARLIELAEAEHTNGQLHRAVQYYNTIMQNWPETYVGWAGLAICAAQRGDHVVSGEFWNRAKDCPDFNLHSSNLFNEDS